MKSLLLYAMIFCHIIADFNLQGCLANMKCKDWWQDHYPDKKYEDDYSAAMWIHAFAWSFMIHIPVIAVLICRNMMTVTNTTILSLTFWTNMWVHFWVDMFKANVKLLNLWQDQLFHMLQIILTHVCYVYVMGILK